MTLKVWIACLMLGVAASGQAPVLRVGISVDMAVTSSAVPMAAAEQEGSLIVTVTRSGAMYSGVTVVTPTALTTEIRRAGAGKVYIKADVGAPYSNVAAVFGALRNAGATSAMLLTSQRDPADGRNAPPKGLEVSISALRDSGEKQVGLVPTGPMSFGEVVRIIDASRSAGAKILLVTPMI